MTQNLPVRTTIAAAMKTELLARTAACRTAENDSLGECAVCFEAMPFNVSISLSGCTHSFHKACVLRSAVVCAFARRPFQCPLCRSAAANVKFIIDVTDEACLPGVTTIGSHFPDAIRDRWGNWHVYAVEDEATEEFFVHNELLPSAVIPALNLDAYVRAETTSFVPWLGVLRFSIDHNQKTVTNST